jgi:hypothetical protein
LKDRVKICEIQADVICTTPIGAERIKRNLKLDVEDVVEWCKEFVKNASPSAFLREGKNWYVRYDNIVLTVNASSYTIITAHKISKH